MKSFKDTVKIVFCRPDGIKYFMHFVQSAECKFFKTFANNLINLFFDDSMRRQWKNRQEVKKYPYCRLSFRKKILLLEER